MTRTNIPVARMLASLISFAFVFLWHGMQMFIFIWAFFNFLGLTIEGVARSIGNAPRYMKFQAAYLSSKNRRRFECALAAPLLAFSAISNFYFFAGTDIGHSFMYRIFHGNRQSCYPYRTLHTRVRRIKKKIFSLQIHSRLLERYFFCSTAVVRYQRR